LRRALPSTAASREKRELGRRLRGRHGLRRRAARTLNALFARSPGTPRLVCHHVPPALIATAARHRAARIRGRFVVDEE
jgi:hypothetical protein